VCITATCLKLNFFYVSFIVKCAPDMKIDFRKVMLGIIAVEGERTRTVSIMLGNCHKHIAINNNNTHFSPWPRINFTLVYVSFDVRWCFNSFWEVIFMMFSDLCLNTFHNNSHELFIYIFHPSIADHKCFTKKKAQCDKNNNLKKIGSFFWCCS